MQPTPRWTHRTDSSLALHTHALLLPGLLEAQQHPMQSGPVMLAQHSEARLLFQAGDQVALVAGLHARKDAEAGDRAGLLCGRHACKLAARQAAQARYARG